MGRGAAPARADQRAGPSRRGRRAGRPSPDAAGPLAPLDVFNASPEARKVAGLSRSLGEPRVCVATRATATLITVAWDLSWYRWQVHGAEVTQTGARATRSTSCRPTTGGLERDRGPEDAAR